MYDYEKGVKAIKEILDNNAEIEEKEVPKDESDFTYGNGIKSWIGSIFIDIIGSTELIKNNSEIKVAKILRSFTSEAISILNYTDNVRQIGVRGDCVYGIYSTPKQKDIYELFDLTCYLNDLVKMLNKLFKSYGYPSVSVGIGLAVGKDLVIKAGKKGTGINDRIWIGDAVVDACNLANKAGRNGKKVIGINELAYNNFIKILEEKNSNKNVRDWFTWNQYDNCYYCNVIITSFDDWIEQNL